MYSLEEVKAVDQQVAAAIEAEMALNRYKLLQNWQIP